MNIRGIQKWGRERAVKVPLSGNDWNPPKPQLQDTPAALLADNWIKLVQWLPLPVLFKHQKPWMPWTLQFLWDHQARSMSWIAASGAIGASRKWDPPGERTFSRDHHGDRPPRKRVENPSDSFYPWINCGLSSLSLLWLVEPSDFQGLKHTETGFWTKRRTMVRRNEGGIRAAGCMISAQSQLASLWPWQEQWG